MERPNLPQAFLAVAALALLGASLVGYATRDSDATASGSGPNGVRIADFAFAPEAIQVSVGDTITWSNDDEFPHTVTSDRAGPLDSGELGGGRTFEMTFNAAGSFEYVCTIHPSMRGTVDVGSG